MWLKNLSVFKECPAEKFQDWMQKPQNLGAALRKVCAQLSLNVIQQNFNRPFEDEYEILGLSKNDDLCFLRSIFLEGNGLPFTYGRVVVPQSVYLNYEGHFRSLGNKLIGETLLYGNPNTVRSEFEFSPLKKDHPLFESLSKSLPKESTLSDLFWARRSVFHLNKIERLLITEVFLNEIPVFVE